MEGVIYEKTIVPATECGDGETDTKIILTREVNGWAVFLESFEVGVKILQWIPNHMPQSVAIEKGVDVARRHLHDQAQKREHEETNAPEG